MPPIYLHYLNAPDVEALALTDDEILAAVEAGLAAQGRGETVIEPRMHLVPDRPCTGISTCCAAPSGRRSTSPASRSSATMSTTTSRACRRRSACCCCSIPRNGVPKAIIDGSHLTDMRTGAVTAIGAKHLARKDAQVLGHIGARGTAYWNVRLLDQLFDFDEIRVHSRRTESRDAFAARLAATSASRSRQPRTGSPASRAPTSWSKRRA